MSSLSGAAVHPGDALIAKPPRPAHVHASRNYSALAPAVTQTQQQQQQQTQYTTPGPGGASPYTDYVAPPVGSVSVADAATGHGLHVSLPVGFDAHLQSGERSVGGRSLAPQSSLMLEDDDAETFLTEERNCCCGLCGCRSCACGRCLSHTWFLLACCGFVFLSSLPRILTLVDFIVTALIYSLSFADSSGPSLSFWAFLHNDFANYSFRTSGGSLVILSLARMMILFWTFAYRFHLSPWAFIVATIVACVSAGFVTLKFALNTNPHLLSLLLWSLGITITEWGVWMSLRRQRIKNPDLRIDHHHHIEAAQAAAIAAAVDDDGTGTSAAEARLLEQGHHRHSPSMHPEEAPVGRPRTLAADIRPAASVAASSSHKQVSSYQRLDGEEQMALPPSMVASSPRIGLGSTRGAAGSASSSFSSSSSTSLGSSLLFPRLGAPAEREVDPQSLADADSLFIEIDSLIVHYKLSINGRAIVGRDAERQARAWGAAAREGRDILAASHSMSSAHSQTHSRASEDDAHDRTPSANEDEPLRGSKSAGSSFSPAGAPVSFGAPPIASATDAAAAPHTFRHPIVLLHGFGSSLFAFRALWLELSQQCSILLAFDRPGFGLTSRPLKDASGSYGSWVERDELNPSARGVLREQSNPYTSEYSAALLLKLLSKLGLGHERCVFVGHSTGGSLALRTAIVHPELTLGCFLISPHILTAGFPDLVKSLLATKLGKMITQQLVRSEMGEVALKRAWYDASHIPPEALANYQRILGVRHQMEGLMEVSAASAAEKERDSLANLAEHFATLAVPHARGAASAAASSASATSDLGAHAPGLLPLLLLHGVQDKLLSVSESSRVYRALKTAGANVTLIKINHCGHVPHEEYPPLTLEHLYGFLHDIEEGGAGAGSAAATGTGRTTVQEEDEEQ